MLTEDFFETIIRKTSKAADKFFEDKNMDALRIMRKALAKAEKCCKELEKLV